MPKLPKSCTLHHCTLSSDSETLTPKEKNRHVREYHFKTAIYEDHDTGAIIECTRDESKESKFHCICESSYKVHSSFIRHLQNKECEHLNDFVQRKEAFKDDYFVLRYKPDRRTASSGDESDSKAIKEVKEMLQSIEKTVLEVYSLAKENQETKSSELNTKTSQKQSAVYEPVLQCWKEESLVL
ncbi:hypothetical protein BCR41DRAFT_215028 [Lobosporangium transversale]|uniref:Uncharacterized protein n=1 Tax=Lobosporangium transversale TaxID=64571 RepID=A0A1Y2G781_9FUNG|nr:hypothetical protein BCR41DRAFT_215028 [Lobosporangium transversale]ORY99698.1 hypothetical protein BCR41DRAFT_215028 [Lobosporangium transversale]|eukprot:XP_021875962.1 hypothetical protein BCR41DRAFT_215028 [Lobosporangium transversale]